MGYMDTILQATAERQEEILAEGKAVAGGFMERVTSAYAGGKAECGLAPRAFKTGVSIQLTWNEIKWARVGGKLKPLYIHIPKGGRTHAYSLADLERRLGKKGRWAFPFVVSAEERFAELRRELAELGRVRLAARRADAIRRKAAAEGGLGRDGA